MRSEQVCGALKQIQYLYVLDSALQHAPLCGINIKAAIYAGVCICVCVY